MNAPEKNVVRLALCLLVIGMVMRYLPWGLPSIGTFEVGDAVVVAMDTLTVGADGSRPPDPAVSGTGMDDVVQKDPPFRGKSQKTAPKVKLPVHVNSASLEELCALKGVGPKLAEKIIAVREAQGPFKTGADLQKVPGIGKKKLEGMISGLIFD